MGKEFVRIENSDGSFLDVELVTYLFDDIQQLNYIVYSKGEISGAENDEVIYISKIINDGNNLIIDEIVDDQEWVNVQNLLKKIANVQ